MTVIAYAKKLVSLLLDLSVGQFFFLLVGSAFSAVAATTDTTQHHTTPSAPRRDIGLLLRAAAGTLRLCNVDEVRYLK